MHNSAVEGSRVKCTRCGATRQRHVQLAAQKRPVRGLYRGGAEVADGTAVYVAWAATVKATHCRIRPASEALPLTASDPRAFGACSVAEAVVQPVALSLRPSRSHVMVRSADVEFCLLCFGRAPRFHAMR